jgi:hypothetical protein
MSVPEWPYLSFVGKGSGGFKTFGLDARVVTALTR